MTPCMKPPAKPTMGIIIIDPMLNRILNHSRAINSSVAVLSITDGNDPKSNATMIPEMSPITVDITPNIKAKGTIGTWLIVFVSN